MYVCKLIELYRSKIVARLFVNDGRMVDITISFESENKLNDIVNVVYLHVMALNGYLLL